MSTLMKRSLLVLACTGLTAAVVIAQSGTPAGTPAMPTKDQVKDAAKDAMEKGKKAAEDAVNKAKEAAGGAAGGAGGVDMQAMEAEMMKAMQPGPMHEWLKHFEGEWDTTVKSFQSPGGEPQVMKMHTSSTMAMGGRYLLAKVTGEIDMGPMGKVPFEGLSTMGYDNMQKKFISTWYDNMSTGMMIETGTVDGAGKVLTLEGENWNMFTNGMAKSKSVTTVIDDKTHKLEMWSVGPDGKMMKSMEIEYVKK